MIASTQTNHPIGSTGGSRDKSVNNPVKEACDRLRTAGLRITQPRIAILEALAKRAKPVSIEQLHGDLAGSACDLVTVYRCLAAFQDLGMVRRCYFENGTSLYQLQLDGETAYHVVSRSGEIVEPIGPELTIELRELIARIESDLKARGFTEVSHLVEFFAAGQRSSRSATVAPAVPSH